MKKLFVMLITIALLSSFAVAVFATGNGKEDEELQIGVVIPYEIGWFTAFHQGFELVATAEGAKVNWQYNNYKADEETKAVQNLITLGVDGMNITSVSPAAAEYSCRLANEADIPIQITESGIAEGAGKPFADVDFN